MSHKISSATPRRRFRKSLARRPRSTKLTCRASRAFSIYRLVINEGCFREPHWHANADELGYCLKGRALVTIFSSGNLHSQFTISTGEMFFVPSGSLHSIENIGNGTAEFIITFSHEMPEDFGLSGFSGSLAQSVLANTWGLRTDKIDGVTRSPKDIQLGRSAGPVEIPESAHYASPYKFAIEARAPLVSAPTGSAIVARRDTWPALKKQAMYSLRVQGIGMREPHWHPETAELGYVHTGRARMTVQDFGGNAETYELSEGDVYFIPRAYPHHIENLTDGEMRFLIFSIRLTCRTSASPARSRHSPSAPSAPR